MIKEKKDKWETNEFAKKLKAQNQLAGGMSEKELELLKKFTIKEAKGYLDARTDSDEEEFEGFWEDELKTFIGGICVGLVATGITHKDVAEVANAVIEACFPGAPTVTKITPKKN